MVNFSKRNVSIQENLKKFVFKNPEISTNIRFLCQGAGPMGETFEERRGGGARGQRKVGVVF